MLLIKKGGFCLKEILYLDTELIHSYLAQIDNGLTGDTTNERGQQIQDEKHQSASSEKTTGGKAIVRSGKLKVPFLLDTPDGEVEIKVDVSTIQGESSGVIQTEDGREIVSKKLHDNALTNLEDYLVSHSLIKDFEEASENDYIKFQSSFQAFNITYLKTMMNPEALERTALAEIKNSIDELKKEKVRELASISNNAQKNIRKRQYDEAIITNEELLNTQIESFKNTHFLLGYLEDILPTKTFIKFNNSVALCKDNFLREQPNILMYKYPQKNDELKLTILGKKTRKIGTSPEAPLTQSLFSILSVLDNLMIEFQIANENDYILSPVAIYFE